jgi:hypothetical protein
MSFQAPDALPWPHLLMMVSGGAGHVQWPQQTMQPPLTGQGSGAQDAGYQTPELSENDAEFAGHQRGPFQPMVPCMMMPMEAFVSMDGQHARNMPAAADRQGYHFNSACSAMSSDWQDLYRP